MWLRATIVSLCMSVPALAENQAPQDERAALEAQVAQVLQLDNVSRREHIGVVFELADRYAREGRDAEAIRFYQEALSVDSWRLGTQLKLARLLHKQGDTAQAIEKIKTVTQYAEEDALIREAEQLLADYGAALPMEAGTPSGSAAGQAEIVMVPIGPVNQRLLDEVRASLQTKLGITFSVADTALDPGTLDRKYAEQYVTTLVEAIRASLTPEAMQELQVVDTLLGIDLDTFGGKVQFIERFLRQSGREADIEGFRKVLEELEGQGQYDAQRFLTLLEERSPLARHPALKGYLGITEQDLFHGDNNFVFGWAGKGYGVMSYRRFLAAFHQEPPNRQRLRDRTVKQAISSSFFILGIPRCTSPTCVRAYPHSLTEHDQKGVELCSWCQEQLRAALGQGSPE